MSVPNMAVVSLVLTASHIGIQSLGQDSYNGSDRAPLNGFEVPGKCWYTAGLEE